MELRHLRYFCAVAEYSSFTLAAKQLNVSQSGVSGQVRDLEKEIGVPLLRRSHREVSLTPHGVIFLEEAREILVRADRAVELALRTSRGQSGRLTIGLCGPVTAPMLPKLIRTFRKQYPGVLVALKERTPAEQVNALIDRQIDLAFTRSISSEVKHLVSHELLFRERVVAVLEKGHRLADEETVTVAMLARERMILYYRDDAPTIFDAIIAMCKKARFSPRIVDTPRSWQSILTLVEAGEGVALVPECVRYLRTKDVVFKPLKGGCRLDVIVAWRRNEPALPLEGFLSLLRPRFAPKLSSAAADYMPA